MLALRGQYIGWLATVVFVSSGCAYVGDLKEPLANFRQVFKPIGETMNPKLYVVQVGDNLSYIAWRYQTTVNNLVVWNNLSDPDALQPGQPIIVRGVPVASVAVAQVEQAQGSQTQLRPYVGDARLEAVPLRPQVVSKVEETNTVIVPPSSEPTVVAIASPSKPRVNVESGAAVQGKVVVSPASYKKPSAERWIWPVNGQILKPFGGSSSNQKGIDISSVPGEPVRATTGGIVAFAGSDVSVLGNAVIIDHEGDLVSAYTKVGELLVEEGEEIMAGDVIAYAAGVSGREKSKVHFEIRKQGRALDPLSRLSKR